MIRAISLAPAMRWMVANDRPVDSLLRSVGLSSAPYGDPLRPVPLLHVGKFLQALARAEGPDIPTRIVNKASGHELALLGSVALGTKTPAEAMTRIAAALPYFCSHEHLSLQTQPEGIVARHSYRVIFDSETRHLMYQYAVAMADRLCAMTGATPPRFQLVEMPPHPEHGVSHLENWFGPAIHAKQGNAIRIVISSDVVHRPFVKIAKDRSNAPLPPGMVPLNGDGSIASSARTMLGSMLEDGVPTIEKLALAAGTSVRTLQRRLKEEGTSFAVLLEVVRQDAALRLVLKDNRTMMSISAEIGYRRQASLTRAVRRWTGLPPTHLRRQKP